MFNLPAVTVGYNCKANWNYSIGGLGLYLHCLLCYMLFVETVCLRNSCNDSPRSSWNYDSGAPSVSKTKMKIMKYDCESFLFQPRPVPCVGKLFLLFAVIFKADNVSDLQECLKKSTSARLQSGRSEIASLQAADHIGELCSPLTVQWT